MSGRDVLCVQPGSRLQQAACVIDPNKISALVNWLVAGAPPKQSFADLVGEIGKRAVATGLPVNQFGLYQNMIHPEMPGRYNYWTEAAGSRMLAITPDELRHGDVWLGTPAETCMTSGRLVAHKLGESPQFDHRPNAKQDLKRGYTQFVYTPLHSHYSLAASVAAYGTKAKGGFSDADVHSLRKIQAPLARVVEAHVLHQGTMQVLSTYVGRDAGSRVLTGNIVRGYTEVIPSIVLFADLKNFTALSNARPASAVIETLNTFYDVAERAIVYNSGEILKFMGDGLLAIFPTPDDLTAQLAAATGAIAALEETHVGLAAAKRPDISFRAALHLGDIHYGNVGSRSRLDFTAIGPTVNLAARLMSIADDVGTETICSEAFHELVPERTELLGEHAFKGFETAQKVYGVKSEVDRDTA